jgi:hypothetical protein
VGGVWVVMEWEVVVVVVVVVVGVGVVVGRTGGEANIGKDYKPYLDNSNCKIRLREIRFLFITAANLFTQAWIHCRITEAQYGSVFRQYYFYKSRYGLVKRHSFVYTQFIVDCHYIVCASEFVQYHISDADTK